MAAEARITFRAEARQAQGEIQNLRGKLAQLNQTLAEQKNRLIGATAEEKKHIRAQMAANNALKATIRSRIEQANLQKQAIAQTMKEARERERAAQQQVRASQQQARERERAAQQEIRASQQISAAQRAVVQELTVGARVIYQQLSQVTGGFVRAAADMETFRNTINVVTQDADETNRVLGDLLKLTVELVGIDTRDLINYAGRLMATGLSAEEAQTAISGVTKRVAEQGKTAFTTRRVLEQFTQAINANHISYHDFRPILRELPTLYRDASNALGVQINSLEDFRRASESVGGPTQAILLLLNEMERASEGANLDTLNAQLDILRDLSRVLAAELGEHLIPAIVAIVKEINVWIERFRTMDDRAQAAIAWAAALVTAVTGLVVVVGTATLGFGALSASLSALTGASGIAALTAGVGGLVAALAAAAPYIAVGGIIIGGIALLAKAIDDTSESARVLSVEMTRLDKVTQVYNLTTGQLEKLTTAQANSYTKFRERVKGTQDEIQSLSTRLQENREEQEKLNAALKNVSSPDAFLVLEQDLENVIAKEQELVAALDEATDKLAGLKFEIAPDESELTEPIESLEEQIIRAVDEVLRLRDAFGEVSRSGDIQEIQAAASHLTTALKRELDLQLQDTELTAAERLDLETAHAREVESVNREAHARITKINEEHAEQQAEVSRRQADARIQSAERARAAEVAGFQRAAQSGQEYAEQLSQLATVSQRNAFVDIVEKFQEQGLSFDEARAKAEPYIDIIGAIPPVLNEADAAYGRFTSTLVSESERSANAIANLISGVESLADMIGSRFDDLDVAGSLERSILNEQRYFEQNPTGRTLDDIQREAGEQGTDYVNRLFGRQDQEAERTEQEATREAAQELREMASAIDSVIGELTRFEGDIGSLTTKIGQFDIQGLASGNPLSIATLPFQLFNAFTFDQRQAEALRPQLDRENREAFERGEFGIPTDLLEFGRGQLGRAIGLTDNPQLTALLEGLDPRIGRTTLDEVATIPDRIIETIQSYTESVLVGLQEQLNQASFNLDFAQQTGGDVEGALQDVIRANTALYQEQIDSYNLQRLATGRAVGNVEELNRILNELNNQARLQLDSTNQITPSAIRSRQRSTRATAERTGTDRQFTEDIARAQYGDVAYDAEVAAAAPTPAESIAPVIESVNEGIEIINAAILSIETRIEQSNDPEEIARLLSQVPDLIRQKYEMLRKALETRFGAGEITESVFNASLSELQSNEAREIERHSDAVLANTLRIIDEDAQLINASITALETQIDQSNDPAEIATLLDQVPALITEKYRLLRQALDEKYVAGEISVDVYNASLTAINNSQASETERHSDAVLANTLSEIDDNVALIDANIEALQFSVSGSDDPQAIAGFLEAIRILIADKYRRLRERLNELLAAEEISKTAFDAAILGLTTAENRALAGIDTQALNAISAAAQERVEFINGSIENLRRSLQLTDDPAEIQQILDAIKVLTTARFTVLREELEALRETLKPEQYQQALKGLNLAETLALENLDTEKFDAISAEAQKQVTAINTDIENLRLSLQLTDDPAKRQAILDAIRILTVARFTVLREELEDIKDSLDPEDYNRALKGINLGEQVALSNIDTEKFDEISAEAMKQVEAINGTIENLRLALQLTTDPTETQSILDAIKILTAARFDVLIQELHDIRDSMDTDDFNRALTGLELGKQVALDNIDTEKFGAISAAAQKQVDFIEGAIDNLELALQLTDDPEEMQRIITSIRILTGKRFDRLIQELKDLRDSFDSDAEFNQALEGLELGKAVALKGIDDRAIGVTLTQIGQQIGGVDFELTQLFEELENETTVAGVRDAIDRLRTAIINKHALMRQKINKSADTEEEKARQIRAVNVQEGQALEGLGQRGLGQLDSLVDTAQFLLDNATEAEFGTRRQNLIDAIHNFYDARIAFINGLDLSDTDRSNMLAVADIQRNIALEAVPQMHESVRKRLELEKEHQDNIKDLRDQETENEQNRLEAIADLNEDHRDRLLDIEQDYQDKLKKIREEEREAGEDILTDQAHSLEDLRNKVARDLFSDAVNFDDLTEEQKQQVRESLDFRRGADDINRQSRRAASEFRQEFGVYRPGSQFGDTGIAQVLEKLESGEITREQALPFIGTRRVEAFEEKQRTTQEAETRRVESEANITAQAEATAGAIQTALAPLITQNQTTADTEATTAQTESETATTAATTATTEATTAIAQASIAELERTNAETFKTGLTALSQAIPKLQDFAGLPNTFRELLSRELSEVRIQRMAIHSPREVKFDFLEVQAGVVNVRGGVVNVPHARSARTVNRSEASPPTEIVVQIDKKEVGRAVYEETTRAEQRGDNI